MSYFKTSPYHLQLCRCMIPQSSEVPVTHTHTSSPHKFPGHRQQHSHLGSEGAEEDEVAAVEQVAVQWYS